MARTPSTRRTARRTAGLTLAAGTAFLAVGFGAAPASAQQSGYGQTLGTSPQERQVYESGPGDKRDSILDATNPIDLMNRIRRSTAMDEATPPGTAVDQALRDFEAQSAPRPAAPASPGSGQMQGP